MTERDILTRDTMTAPCPADGEIGIWHAGTELLSAPGCVERAYEWLTDAERVRYDRYRFDQDRLMFLLGRTMARALVGRALGVAPTAWPWRETGRGRPEIDDLNAPVSFNLAHSCGTVVCVVGRGAAVGVDVEDRARRPPDERVVRRFCAPSEVTDIEAQGAGGWRDRFLTYWTLKEAYLKTHGLGIAIHLADLGFHFDGSRARLTSPDAPGAADFHWSFNVTTLFDQLIVAVAAAATAPIAPRFFVEPMPASLVP